MLSYTVYEASVFFFFWISANGSCPRENEVDRCTFLTVGPPTTGHNGMDMKKSRAHNDVNGQIHWKMASAKILHFCVFVFLDKAKAKAICF